MSNVVFKQSIMGFNREQVLEYIDTLVKQLKDCEEEYVQKQHQLQQEIENLSADCDENRQKLTSTIDKINKLEDELKYFKNNNAELKSQIDYYKNLLLAKDSEMVTVKRENFSLKTRCELLAKDNENWKKRQDKIGQCLIDAQVKAEEIVSNACAEAEQKKQSIEKQAAKLSGDVDNLKFEIAKVEQQLEQSFGKLQKAMQMMETSAKSIEEQVDEYKSKTEKLSIDFVEDDDVKTCSNSSAAKNVHTTAVFSKTKKSLTENMLETISKILG